MMHSRNFQNFISIVSALFATLLFGISLLWILGQFSHQEANVKLRMIFVLTYVIVLSVSGWFFAVFKWRVMGFIHAVLMLGIAGMVLYGIMRGMVTSPGSDNAAAGIVAAADLVFILLGLFSAICGIAVILHLFSKKENSK
jgi:hypothetical protein